MKNHSIHILPGALLLATLILLFTGCVSGRYRMAKEGTPPPELLHVPLATTPLGVELTSLITYGGPGSWKRNAFWDEYVVTLHNPGNQPLTINDASLVDFTGAAQSVGDNPWELEKTSKTLERKYKDIGVAFVRYTAPAAIIVGAGFAYVGGATTLSAAFTTAATATIVLIPVYYLGVVIINHHNKTEVEKEFNRRRLVLPLTLSPGGTIVGSFFFPMVPNPRSLNLRWSSGPAGGESALPLDFLHGLHVKAAVAATPKS